MGRLRRAARGLRLARHGQVGEGVVNLVLECVRNIFLTSLPHQVDGHFVDLGLDHVIRPLHLHPLRAHVDDVIALGHLQGDVALLGRCRCFGAILVEPHARPFHRAAVVHDRDLELRLGCLQVEGHEGGLAGKHLNRLIGFA